MITKLVSGGQTGADIAALDVALRHGFPHGGWCPKGRRSLEGPIPARYLLRETPSADYLQRTEWNVRDTDGTVVFTLASEATGGSLKTIGFARKHKKPCLHLSMAGGSQFAPAMQLREFVKEHGIKVLNVAGSRESKEPGIHDWVMAMLEDGFFGGDTSSPPGGRSPRSPNRSLAPHAHQPGKDVLSSRERAGKIFAPTPIFLWIFLGLGRANRRIAVGKIALCRMLHSNLPEKPLC